MVPIRVELGPRSYDIAAGPLAGVGPFARRCLPTASKALIVTDEHAEPFADAVLASLKAAELPASMVVMQAGEETKSLEWLAELYDELAELPADRRTAVVAVGGGVIGDLAGFAAATYARGLPLLMVPTTLLAMVDSSVGGKTGLNLKQGKNLVGAFHQPSGVWIAPEPLAGLPDAQYRSGLAEVVKYGVILDADFFARLEASVPAMLARDPATVDFLIARSCQLKARVCGGDEREETGDRAALNYGHTFGHAFEAVAGYGAWTHGAAVSAGMVCASRLAERLGRVTADVTERQVTLLAALGLPTAPDPAWDADQLIHHMRRDKKALAGRLRFVLPGRIGHVELVDGVPEADVRAALQFPDG
jgi:3-dehydroquinate synthase